jgi:hypothetical protein
MKRITNWPQAWLGVAVSVNASIKRFLMEVTQANWGAVIAWTTINENLDYLLLACLMVGLFA